MATQSTDRHDAPWTGPSGKEMTESQTLGKEIMARANDPCPVLDEQNLAMLRDFVFDTSPANIAAITKKYGWNMEENDFGGSIIGYAVKMHGSEKPVFTDEDIKALRTWYESGAAGNI